jgi:hypothetical protein
LESSTPQLPKPTDKVFPGNHIKLFNRILKDNGLKLDRDGKAHTLYSLRHYYICQRLMEGADVYQLAKNCRTFRRDDPETLRHSHRKYARCRRD